MIEPTIKERLSKRFIFMTANSELIDQAQRISEEKGWTLVVSTDLESIGEWSDVLLHRMLFLDLDEIDRYDPLDVIRQIRMEYQINIPVICFGGDQEIQNEMRVSRADRFFSPGQLSEVIPMFLDQYNW